MIPEVNKTTVETFNKTDAGKDLHRVSSVKEAQKTLKSGDIIDEVKIGK